jgi:ATP-dependent Clp protease ATP-binding subunit ClpA
MFGRKKRSRLHDIRIMNQLFPAADALAEADGARGAGAEHLLIAALDLDTGSARRAFERVGADPDQFREAVRTQHADAMRAVGVQPINDVMLDRHIPPPVPDNRPHRGSPSGHELFRKVVPLVRKERSQLYGAYFVLAAAETEHGTTARALRHMNVDLTALAAAARSEIDALNMDDSSED